MMEEIEPVYFMGETNILKCLVWSLNAELWIRSVWKDESHVAVELNSLLISFIVMDVAFCEIKQLLIRKNQIHI